MDLPPGTTLQKLLRLYEKNQRTLAKRAEYFKTDEGKEYNRQKARAYYQKHSAELNEKTRARRQAKKLNAPVEPT